jgi:hypothetical protein
LFESLFSFFFIIKGPGTKPQPVLPHLIVVLYLIDNVHGIISGLSVRLMFDFFVLNSNNSGAELCREVVLAFIFVKIIFSGLRKDKGAQTV